MILGLVDEAVSRGARQSRACEVLGLAPRTVERWRRAPEAGDQRRGPQTPCAAALSEAERAHILEVVNRPEFREKCPWQIVATLADRGEYIGSESTLYRVLKAARQLGHRENSRAQSHRRPAVKEATGPCQVWSWDISYLKGRVRGQFYYLYLVLDVWSRRIVGWDVHEEESAVHASRLMSEACLRHRIKAEQLVLHSDNGAPMKGSTLLVTLQSLGVMASFSRPGVSNDNPFSEAMFRTLKYRPEYPAGRFESLESAQRWVEAFVEWYNTEHLHSGLGFVTPDDRHTGRDLAKLEGRRALYERLSQERPLRWKIPPRKWEPPRVVRLNPHTAALREDTRDAA